MVAFGSRMFGKDSLKFRGHRTGVVGVLYRALKRRKRQENVIVVTVDELRISRVKRYSLILNTLLN